MFSASASSHLQHLGPSVLNVLVFPSSTSEFPCPEGEGLGALLHPLWRTSHFTVSVSQFLSGQGSMSQEGEGKAEE